MARAQRQALIWFALLTAPIVGVSVASDRRQPLEVPPRRESRLMRAEPPPAQLHLQPVPQPLAPSGGQQPIELFTNGGRVPELSAIHLDLEPAPPRLQQPLPQPRAQSGVLQHTAVREPELSPFVLDSDTKLLDDIPNVLDDEADPPQPNATVAKTDFFNVSGTGPPMLTTAAPHTTVENLPLTIELLPKRLTNESIPGPTAEQLKLLRPLTYGDKLYPPPTVQKGEPAGDASKNPSWPWASEPGARGPPGLAGPGPTEPPGNLTRPCVVPGIVGPPGAPGPRGMTGLEGARGETGIVGDSGKEGLVGPRGISGYVPNSAGWNSTKNVTKPTCEKWATLPGYHGGTITKRFGGQMAPDGVGWRWKECAAECADAEACEFWSLQLDGNKECQLKVDKTKFHKKKQADATGSTGAAVEGANNTACERPICPDGYMLAPIPASQCPKKPPSVRCDNATAGALCEASGECGTDRELDNCAGGFDVYRKATTPSNPDAAAEALRAAKAADEAARLKLEAEEIARNASRTAREMAMTTTTEEPPVVIDEETGLPVGMTRQNYSLDVLSAISLTNVTIIKGERGLEGSSGGIGDPGEAGLQGVLGARGIEGLHGTEGSEGKSTVVTQKAFVTKPMFYAAFAFNMGMLVAVYFVGRGFKGT